MADPEVSTNFNLGPADYPRDLRRGLLMRLNIPSNYTLSLASNDNETISDLAGPGRLLGNLLAGGGRHVERGINRLAEGLGKGPHMAAHRLTAELHNMHVLSRLAGGELCQSEHVKNVRDTTRIADHLIWVCNGICSQCWKPYFPYPLNEVSTTFKEILGQLLGYLRDPAPSNVNLTATYLGILLASEIIPSTTLEPYSLQAVVSQTLDHLYLRYELTETFLSAADSIRGLALLVPIGNPDVTDCDHTHRFEPGTKDPQNMLISLQTRLEAIQELKASSAYSSQVAFKVARARLCTQLWHIGSNLEDSGSGFRRKFIAAQEIVPRERLDDADDSEPLNIVDAADPYKTTVQLRELIATMQSMHTGFCYMISYGDLLSNNHSKFDPVTQDIIKHHPTLRLLYEEFCELSTNVQEKAKAAMANLTDLDSTMLVLANKSFQPSDASSLQEDVIALTKSMEKCPDGSFKFGFASKIADFLYRLEARQNQIIEALSPQRKAKHNLLPSQIRVQMKQMLGVDATIWWSGMLHIHQNNVEPIPSTTTWYTQELQLITQAMKDLESLWLAPSKNEPISPPAWTPLDNDNVYDLCEGKAMISTRERIRRLGETCNAVQTSFITVIKSVEDLTLLNALKRMQFRAVIQQLPVLRALYEDFKEIVFLSQKEASSASEVFVSYQSTILDASYESIIALEFRDEIDNIAKLVDKHEDEAEKLQVEFTQLSYKIDRVSAAITLAIAKEREEADRRIIAVSQHAAKLGADVEENGKVLQALSVMWVAGRAQDLQEKAKLVAAIGNIWHDLHMELNRISTWLSLMLDRGEWQGIKSPEGYGLVVPTIRDLNREVVHQLDRYAKSQLLQGAHK